MGHHLFRLAPDVGLPKCEPCGVKRRLDSLSIASVHDFEYKPNVID